MPVTIKVDAFNSPNIKQISKLNTDTATGATLITPENIGGFNSNDFIFIGQLGQALTEKRQITISGSNMTVASLVNSHDRFEPITAVEGDQVQFYSAANVDGTPPADSAYSVLGSPVTINPNSLQVSYTDSGGSDAVWYKYVYYNSSVANAVTDLSDVSGTRGGDTGFYVTIDEVRQAAGFKNNLNITDSYIAGFILKACSIINGKVFGLYATPFIDPVPYQIVNIAKLYAIGLMLLDQYGNFAQGSQADGQNRIDQADADIIKITGGMTAAGVAINRSDELYDSKGNSLLIYNPIDGWPDETTAGLNEFDDDGNLVDGGAPIFTISHIF